MLAALISLTAVFPGQSPLQAAPLSPLKDAFDYYPAMREAAVRTGCGPADLPVQLTVNMSDQSINAAASLTPAGAPQIVVNAGLIDFDVLAAYYSLATDPTRSFEVVLQKATDPRADLQRSQYWKEYAGVATSDWEWEVPYKTRLAFALAHEIGHLCKHHAQQLRTAKRPTLHVIDSNGVEQTGWVPAVPLPVGDLAALGGKRTNPLVRQLEEDADDFAVSLLQQNHRSLGLDPASTVGAIGELAVLDAAQGRTSLAADAQTWSHPVGQYRFARISQSIAPLRRGRDYPYLRAIQSLLLCLEPAKDPLKQFKLFLDGDRTLCGPFNLTRAALSQLLPHVQKSATGWDVAVAHTGKGMPIISAGTATTGAFMWPTTADEIHIKTEALAPSSDVSAWSLQLPKSGTYTLDLSGIDAGPFAITVNGRPLVRGTIDDSRRVKVKKSDVVTKTTEDRITFGPFKGLVP